MVQFYLKPCTLPPSPGTPPGICNIFFLLEVYSLPLGTQKETIPHPRAPDRQPHICFLLHLFWSVQKQNDTFSQLLWMFSWVYRKKDNGCHNLVKTWTINLKMNTKKKNSVKRASLIEHFIGRLDQISLSLFVSKALYSFSYLKTI